MAGISNFLCEKPECSHLSFLTLTRYLNHLRNSHIHEQGFKVRCPVKPCFRLYTVVLSLTSHVRRKHRNEIFNFHLNDDADIHTNVPESVAPNEALPLTSVKEKTADEFSPRHLALFTLKTQEINRLTDATTNKLIDNTSELLEQHEAHVKEKIKVCLEKNGIKLEDVDGLEDIMNLPQTPSMDFLKTTKSRNNYLSQEFNMVNPIEIVLGEEYIHNENSRNGSKVKTHSFQYISFIKVLEQLLNQVDVFSQVENTHKSRDGKMRDLCDGDEFSPTKHPLISVNSKAIQMMLYYDDFEVANPLGSKAVIHKIGGFYWMLGNLHRKFRSSLKSLNLVILCPVKWIKMYGMDKVLRPFMSDLALLESDHGVQLNIANQVMPIQGSLSVVLADNLGSNSIGGFMESFSANRPCRFCLGLSWEFQEKFVEEEFTMRTRESYTRQMDLVAEDPESVSVYGVKKPSALNASKYFHVVDGLPSDIMHDILEGVLPLHIKLMLRKFIMEEKFFTLDQFNKQLPNFPFGVCDIKNRPSLIKNVNTGDHHLRQSVHQWIPEENDDWALFSDLMQIVDLLFSPVVEKGTPIYLRLLISEYLDQFKKMYPNVRLIPKQHFMLHYPNQIKRFGPLVHNWCMRFEGKHHYFKLLAQNVRCFKNITKTLATRHQRLQCYWLSEPDGFLRNETEVGPGKVLQLKDLQDEERRSLLHTYDLDQDSSLTLIDWAKICGDKYAKGMVVVYQQFIFPEFLMLHNIFMLPNMDVVFSCKKMQTIAFNSRMRSYEVIIADEFLSVSHSSLVDHYPLDIYTINVNNMPTKFVRMKYDLADAEQ
ncbi:uncharacterized protein LOC110246895 [Paramuricea clavata]|uniref:Uncharacterized protein LOC110246895 n=1 Tax=Paramuricea clavata TaxID=317549 RepID=A0A6S7HTT3_PARCT|nr:uncharacterized protein LOC110246895 [Paramuricea clavata]